MRRLLIASAVIGLLAGCGVNPDRLATMQQKNEEMAEQGEAVDPLATLEYDDRDPAGIRDAIMAVKDMQASLKSRDYDGYMTRRYEAVSLSQFQASQEVKDHPKNPLIKDAIHSLDTTLAERGNQRAQDYVASNSRTETASVDALYSIQDAFDTCGRAYQESDTTSMNELYGKYQASLDRAVQLDASAAQYVGKRANGTGLVDVPAEVANCEARIASRMEESADEPAAATSKSEAYQGCGSYVFGLEAAQTGTNRFGAYQLTTENAQSANPTGAESVDCGTMPPVSDAPAAIQKLVRSAISWVAEGDAISMSGPFEYEQREQGVLYKKGAVKVFSKAAALQTGACGNKDPRITCEAEGSEAIRAYNHGSHYLKRADVHRVQGNADRCKEMADRAYKAVNVPAQSGDTERLFVSSSDEQMTYAELTSKIEALKSQANDMLASDWCTKP